MGCQSGYKFPASGLGFPDFDDVFVRKEYFSEGGLWLWGDNANGILGTNGPVTDLRSSPVQTISGGTNWIKVTATTQQSAGIKSDGTLWLWGRNNTGTLGNNNIIDRSSPVQTVSGGTNWKEVSLGDGGYTAAIKTDGTLWLWGNGGGGRLGNNAALDQSSPVQTISGGTNWKQASASISNHTAAIKTDGTLWVWGGNSFGVLGNNSTVNQSSPIQTISGGNNWKQVSSGRDNVAAVKTDGTLWLWGRNGSGQLGDNSVVVKSSPVQTISGGTNWKQVGSGECHVAAIKTDGTLWTWGRNTNGQLGDNTVIDTSSPIQTVSGGTNWKQICTLAGFTTTAIKTDGTLWLWGANGSGQLGINAPGPRSSPVQTVSGGTNWKDVAAGCLQILGIREDCW